MLLTHLNPLSFQHYLIILIITQLQYPSFAQRDRQSCFSKTRPVTEAVECDPNYRYRSASGRCNNLQNSEWGSSGSTLRRFIPPAYQDGQSIPRGGRSPSSLPNPRWISQKNHPDSDIPDSRFTHMVMQFGQFLDHDVTLTPKDEEINCCQIGVDHPNCFTIDIPNVDRFYSWVNTSASCLHFVRSQPVCGESVRQQYNIVTSYVDASNVYGSEPEHAALLRTYVDGRLQRNSNTEQLPTRQQLNSRPNPSLLRPEKSDDFMAGDMRVNEHPFLVTAHVIFMREHNRIAKRLKEYLPTSLHQDEILYQETRRLVSAEMQNIVYGEYLPTILGVDFMKTYNLIVQEETDYDPSVDATAFNSFGTAAFRFGHSMINGMFKLVSQRGEKSEGGKNNDVYWLWRLREVFDGQSLNGLRLPLENMLEGLISQEPQTVDRYFSTEITDHLFQKNSQRENFGEDLLALNLQRGRDHGLPPYNEFRRACGLRYVQRWEDVPVEHDQDYWDKLRDVYDNVNDIDLFVGGIAEYPVRGGVVGPTFACLISEQFRRTKLGDRFFYTHKNANGLSPVAKREVLKRTLGDILCDVTQLKKVQKWITLQPNSEFNPYRDCLNNQKIDIKAIAEEIAQELLSNPQRLGSAARSLFNNSSQHQSLAFRRPESDAAIQNPVQLQQVNLFQPNVPGTQLLAGQPTRIHQNRAAAANPACVLGFC